MTDLDLTAIAKEREAAVQVAPEAAAEAGVAEPTALDAEVRIAHVVPVSPGARTRVSVEGRPAVELNDSQQATLRLPAGRFPVSLHRSGEGHVAAAVAAAAGAVAMGLGPEVVVAGLQAWRPPGSGAQVGTTRRMLPPPPPMSVTM